MKRIAMIVLWPSFLAATLAEACFFSLFDPEDLANLGGAGLTPMAVTGLLKVSPMAPAYYVAVLCMVGFSVGLYLLANKR